MGKTVLELLPINFGNAVHLRTGSVQAAGQSPFSFAAILRMFNLTAGSAVAVFGNTTDRAATNGWCFEVTGGLGAGNETEITLDFSCCFATIGKLTSSLVMPLNYTTGSKPICVIGIHEGTNVRLYVNGQEGSIANTAGNALIAGTGRLCLGSMPSPQRSNVLDVAISSAAYIDASVAGTRGFIAQSMIETGSIPYAGSMSAAPAWSHHYSIQRSSLSRQTTLGILQGGTSATLTALENIGTLGSSGDMAPLGAATGYVQSCFVGPGVA